jgi:predicted NBD/HSP70 family sugar kinase
LAFDAGTSANDVAFLAVGTSDGAVTLLNVTLWRGEHVIAGKKLKVGPRDTSPRAIYEAKRKQSFCLRLFTRQHIFS